MKKPTVYLDTNIISSYWYEGADVSMLARRIRTREWWDLERRHFTLCTSAFCEAELQAGVFSRQSDCLKMVRRLRYLPATTEIRQLVETFLHVGLVPPNEGADGAHLASATHFGIDYLLTWNYAHIANPVVQGRLETLCDQKQLVAPLLVSPESIPQVRFGQEIRRHK